VRTSADESNRIQNERLVPWWKQEGHLADLSRGVSKPEHSSHSATTLADLVRWLLFSCVTPRNGPCQQTGLKTKLAFAHVSQPGLGGSHRGALVAAVADHNGTHTGIDRGTNSSWILARQRNNRRRVGGAVGLWDGFQPSALSTGRAR